MSRAAKMRAERRRNSTEVALSTTTVRPMLTEGQPSPRITLHNQNDESVDSVTLRGMNVLVYPDGTLRNVWYKISPKDTPVRPPEALGAR